MIMMIGSILHRIAATAERKSNPQFPDWIFQIRRKHSFIAQNPSDEVQGERLCSAPPCIVFIEENSQGKSWVVSLCWYIYFACHYSLIEYIRAYFPSLYKVTRSNSISRVRVFHMLVRNVPFSHFCLHYILLLNDKHLMLDFIVYIHNLYICICV